MTARAPMPPRRILGLVTVGALCCAATISRSEDALRDWTVPDSIGVRYFVQDISTLSPGWIQKPAANAHPIALSPDGKLFFFMSFHGDLSTDTMVYRLDVYSVDAVRQALSRGTRIDSEGLPPFRTFSVATARSRNDMSGILQPTWEGNGAIVFLGVQGEGRRRLYRYDVLSDTLSALTAGDADVVWGGDPTTGISGNTIVYAAMETRPWRPLDEYPMATIRSDELAQAENAYQSSIQIRASYLGGAPQTIARLARNTRLFGPWISPNGKYALAAFAPDGAQLPREWSRYEIEPRSGYRFMLLDLVNGMAKPVLDAPGGAVTSAGANLADPFQAFWSADSRHVMVFNTALPLTENAQERQRMSYVIDYSIEDARWRVLEPMANAHGRKVLRAAWARDRKSVLLSYSDGQATRYTFDGSRWVGRAAGSVNTAPAAPTEPREFRVSVRQNINDPPRMVASTAKKSVVLSAPDPALRGVWRAEAKTVQWSEGGRTLEGALMLPRGYVRGQRLPTIIQGHAYHPEAFRPDGVAFGAFAAQSFVAQGFAVLQIDFAYDDLKTTYHTPAEMPARVARIDAVVGKLAADGIADPDRIGLIGFSRSGYSTYYTITHPGRVNLGAAVIFDSITASYGEYVIGAAMGNSGTQVYEKQYGDGTFWQNKEAWLKDAPAFNVEKVKTPVLFMQTAEGYTGVQAHTALETVGAFRLNRKPFEYLVFGQGTHMLQRPRERAAAMQASVDWMNFWLRDKGPEPESGDRSQRWRTMKADWIRQRDLESERSGNQGTD